MAKSMQLGLLGAAAVVLWVGAASAETIELVTYYPTPASQDSHVRSLTVGTAYGSVTPGDGVALIYDKLGIGPGFTAAAPPTEALEAVGNILATSSVGSSLFKANRGVNTIPNGLQLLTNGVPKWTIGSRAGSEGLHLYSDAATATRLFIEPATGNVGIGTAAPAATALLDMTSTTQGFLPPRMTTAQRQAIASPAAGLMVFDTTLGTLLFYNGTGWREMWSGASQGPPIGTILAWHKSMPGTPALPAGWVECNGQTLSDAASPYNGFGIPNLNSSRRFLRGSTTSGTLQAGTRHDYRLVVDGGVNAQYLIPAFQASQDPVLNFDWDTWVGSFGGFGSFPTSISGSFGGATGTTRPINMSVVYIMRVK